MAGLNSSIGGRRRAGRVHVDGLQAEQRAVHDVGEGVLDPLERRTQPALAARRMRATSSVRGRHASSSAITGSSWRGGRVVAVRRDRNAATWRSPVRAEPPATAASLSAAAWNTRKTGS